MSRSQGATGPNVGSVPFRVCVFFATNPEEHLTTRDVVTKFGCDWDDSRALLRSATIKGLLSAVKGPHGEGRTYRAGPELLAMIGFAP